MKRFSPSRQRSLTFAALLLAALATTTKAGPLDARVPADAIAYVGWAGSDALQGQYTGSNLKGILDASTIQDFVMKQLPGLIDQAKAQNPRDAKAVDMLQKGLLLAWKHPLALYVRSVDFTNPQQPLPRIGFMCDAGADAKALTDLLTDALALNPPPPEMKVHIVADGNVVHFSIGSADTPDDLKKNGGLAAAGAYKAAMDNAKHPTPAMAVYVDATKVIATINDALAKVPGTPPEAKVKVPATIEALGLNGLTQIAYTAGFDGKGWSDQMFIGTNGQRKSLLALIGSSPLSDTVLAMVPKDAAAFSAAKFDLHKLFTEIRDAVGKVDVQAQKQMDEGLARAGQMANLDVEKDVLAPLGDEWVIYRAPPPDGGGNSVALVSKLKDGATFAKTVAAIEKAVNANLQNSPLKIEKVSAAKTEVSTIAILNYSIAWTVKGDMLYIAPLDAIGGAIKQVDNKLPSIAESDLYKAARATLPPNVKPMSITYENPAKLYPQLRVLGLGALPLLRSNGIQVPNDIFPDPDDVSKFMLPGAGITWADATGIHSAEKSAFPGAALLSGQQSAPVFIALGAAVALPALGTARQTATVTADAANLRGIAQSCIVYAADHKDQLPDDLARLCVEGMVSPRMLVSSRATTAPLTMTAEMQKLAKDDFAKFSEQVAEHTDYVYLGKGMKLETDAEIIVAYEKAGAFLADGINIAYQDGHVEFTRWGGLEQAFKKTNEVLKKAGKPEVDVQALVKSAGVAVPPTVRGLP